jgi:hypothetical protein
VIEGAQFLRRSQTIMATAADSQTRVEFVEVDVGRQRVLGWVDRERRFYAIAAFAMLALTAVGFRDFLLRGQAAGRVPMTPQIVVLVVIHGLAMLGWVVLF